MLSFENFILRQNEGLVETYPLDESIRILERGLADFPYWVNIDKKYENNSFSIRFDGVINVNELEWLMNLINNLGYYCSAYNLFKNKKRKYFIWVSKGDYLNDIKNCNEVEFLFESKFDEILKHKPSIIYHVTERKNIEKIIKIGIVPKSKHKKTYHMDRIYVALHLDLSIKIKNMFIYDKIRNSKLPVGYDDIKDEYIILELNITDNFYKDMKIYKDPNMKGGYYIYNNIRPQDIKIIDG
jgi:hypothetical protein